MCLLCGCKLLLRKDRSSTIVIYDDKLGTLPGGQYRLELFTFVLTLRTSVGTHFRKYCTGRACGFTQYYGYYTRGGKSSDVFFNMNWHTLQYFVQSRETAFSVKLTERFNANILLGQQSFKQCADVYNYLNKKQSGLLLT